MRRALPLVVCLLAAVTPAHSQVAHVVTLADSLVGAVGGIAVDRLGNVYSADFKDTVWRITPDGRVTRFAEGLYGASGNFIDSRGRLLQSSFYGNTVSRIDRTGRAEILADQGLTGPVGVTETASGEIYVCNCQANTIGRIDPETRTATEIASGPLFQCPNGITSTRDGTLYVVNFNNGHVVRISPGSEPEVLATIPGPGNGHIAFAQDNLYVTTFQTHRVYRVGLDGTLEPAAGTGAPGEVDGPPDQARFTLPNGIAATQTGDRLYVNDYVNRAAPSADIPPTPYQAVRLVKLASFADRLAAAYERGGVDAMRAEHEAFRASPATANVFTQVVVNQLGYRYLQAGDTEAAIAVFQINVADYPNAFNPHDSLGEAYLAAGRTEEAIASYRKSLELNPANQNARDVLARIGAR